MATRTQKRFNQKVRFSYVPTNLNDARNEVFRPFMIPNINRTMPTLKRRKNYNGVYQLYAGISDKVCKQGKRDPTPLFEPFKDPNVLNRNFTYNKARMMEMGHIEQNPRFNLGTFQATQPIVTKRGMGLGYSNSGGINGFQTNWRPPIKTRQDMTGIVMPTEYNVGSGGAVARKGGFTTYLAPKYNIKAQRKRLDAIYGVGVRKDIIPAIAGLNVENPDNGQVCLKPDRKRVSSGSIILDRAIDIGNDAKGLVQHKRVPWIESKRVPQQSVRSYAYPQTDYIQTEQSKRKVIYTRSGEYEIYNNHLYGITLDPVSGSKTVRIAEQDKPARQEQAKITTVWKQLGKLLTRYKEDSYGSVDSVAQGVAQDTSRLAKITDTRINEGNKGIVPQIISTVNNGLQSISKIMFPVDRTINTHMNQPITSELKANLPQSGIVKSHPKKGILKNNDIPNQVSSVGSNQIPKSETPYYKKILGTVMPQPLFPSTDAALHYGYNNKIIFGQDTKQNRKVLYNLYSNQNKKMY